MAKNGVPRVTKIRPGPGAGGANCWKARGDTGSNILIDIYELNILIYVHIIIKLIEYGHQAKPSILGLQIVFLAAPGDYGDGDYRARQEF